MPRPSMMLVPYSTSAFDRAIWYGDGFFETIMLPVNAKQEDYPPNWLLPHWERIMRSSTILKLALVEMPAEFKEFERFIWKEFKAFVRRKKLNTVGNMLLVRIRLLFVRMRGGLYLPETKECFTELDISTAPRNTRVLTITDSSVEVRLPTGILSCVKSISALPYVLAAREKAIMGFQEMFIENTSGLLAECCASNIFWCIAGQWHTTGGLSGAIWGTMRDRVVGYLNAVHGDNQNKATGSPATTNDNKHNVLDDEEEPPFHTNITQGLAVKDLPIIEHMLTTNANGIAQVEGVVWENQHYKFKPLPASFLMEMYRICSPHQLDEPLKWVAPEREN